MTTENISVQRALAIAMEAHSREMAETAIRHAAEVGKLKERIAELEGYLLMLNGSFAIEDKQQDEAGFTKWPSPGGTNPVGNDDVVDVILRNGRVMRWPAKSLRWFHSDDQHYAGGDIIFYRVAPPEAGEDRVYGGSQP